MSHGRNTYDHISENRPLMECRMMREPTCESGRHRGAWRKERWRNNGRLEKNGDEAGKAWAGMNTEVKGQQTRWRWGYHDSVWNEAWREEHRAGPTGPAAGHPAAITPNGHRCVELIVFIKSESTSAQRNKNLRGTLYKSLMSDGIVHTKCMQAVNYLSCFLFPLTGVRCGLKKWKMKKHEVGWFRRSFHQNVVPACVEHNACFANWSFFNHQQVQLWSNV